MSTTERREFLKKVARGAIYAAPVVRTLAAPDPAQAQGLSAKMGTRPAICDLWDWYWTTVRMVNPPPPCPWWTQVEGPGPLDSPVPPPGAADPFPKAPWEVHKPPTTKPPSD